MTRSGPHSLRTAYAVYAMCWCFLSWPWLSGQVTIPYDAKALFQAQLQFLATALHSGQSPFWNPYTFVGFPQISDPQSLIFSPALILAYLIEAPGYNILDCYVMLLLGAGGAAILTLCLDKQWHPGAGVAAGIAFAFGGSAAWRIQHIGHIQSYAFFAIALWSMSRALDRRSMPWGVAGGFATGLMLVEPDQVALLGCYSLGLYCIGHVLTAPRPRETLASTWRPMLVSTVSCLAVAGIPIALTYLFLQQSNRPIVEFAEAARGSLHPASMLTFVVADLFGALDPTVDYWGPYSTHWNKNELTLSQNMCQIYSGALPALLLLTLGIIRGHLLDRNIRVFTLLMVLSIIYAVGAYTPGYFAFYNVVPGVRAFRRPVDGTFLFGAMVSLVSGYLLHVWLTGSFRSISDTRKICEVGIVAGAVIIGAIVAIDLQKADVAWRPIMLAAAWLIAAALLLLLPDPWIKSGSTAMIALPALFLSLDLRVNNAANRSTGVSANQVADVLKTDTANETITFLKSNIRRSPGSPWRDRVELLGLGFDWQNCSSVHKLENTLGYNPFRIGLVSRALGARDYNVGVDQRTFTPLFPSYRSVLADLLGMRFIASAAPLESIDPYLRPGDLKLVRHTSDAYIYENSRVLPRAILVHEALSADFESIIGGGRWPVYDPHRTVLLSPDEAQLLKAFGATDVHRAAIASDDAVSIERYDHTLIEIKVTAKQSGLLVINDIWHPWWFASVDGQDARLIQANAIFRAVPVPAGSHTVRLEFRPLEGMWHELRRRVRSR